MSLRKSVSVYPSEAVQALENPGEIPLKLIAVQSGTQLGEDDIVRFSDRYSRKEAKELCKWDHAQRLSLDLAPHPSFTR